MPSLIITSIGQTGVQWYITGLSSLWDSNSYQYAYITINGVNSAPIYPPTPTGTGYTTSYGSFNGLTPNTTYTADSYVVAANGITYPAGSATFTTQASPRPSNFAWSSAKTQGQNFNLLASEWTSLCSKINEFRTYKGLSTYSFTSVASGDTFFFWIFNQAVTAISAMSPPTPAPSSVSSGDTVTASAINGLRDSLNSIP